MRTVLAAAVVGAMTVGLVYTWSWSKEIVQKLTGKKEINMDLENLLRLLIVITINGIFWGIIIYISLTLFE